MIDWLEDNRERVPTRPMPRLASITMNTNSKIKKMLLRYKLSKQTVRRNNFKPKNSMRIIIIITWNHNLTKLVKIINNSQVVIKSNKLIKSPLNKINNIKTKGNKKVWNHHILKFAILFNLFIITFYPRGCSETFFYCK